MSQQSSTDGVVLGVDPGVGGALAWVTAAGVLIAVADMPVIEVRGKRRVCAAEVARLMRIRPVLKVVIEGVVAMPRVGKDGRQNTQGAASMLSFGYSAGILEGVAAGVGLEVEIVLPAVWKRRALVPKDKGVVRQMVTRLWPASSMHFARVKDDGRAEAALLARWAATGASCQ